MVEFMIILAKLATLGLFKIKIILKKGYDIIIPLYDVTKKLYPVTQIIL